MNTAGCGPGAIETQARSLQNKLWSLRSDRDLWGSATPASPIDVLQPGVALRLLGYNIKTVETLGQINDYGKRSEVAGIVDNNDRVVAISSRFSPSIQQFTAAHELGHVVLHRQAGRAAFRDIPSDGPIVRRDPAEREADQFAFYFLMPRRLVEAEFVGRFYQKPFVLTDDTAFALGGRNLDAVTRIAPRKRDLSLLLASAQHFDGNSFISLSATFGVSSIAMAIRLEELGLC